MHPSGVRIWNTLTGLYFPPELSSTLRSDIKSWLWRQRSPQHGAVIITERLDSVHQSLGAPNLWTSACSCRTSTSWVSLQTWKDKHWTHEAAWSSMKQHEAPWSTMKQQEAAGSYLSSPVQHLHSDNIHWLHSLLCCSELLLLTPFVFSGLLTTTKKNWGFKCEASESDCWYYETLDVCLDEHF